MLLGDIEEDDWMDDMIQILQKISRPEYRELAKKQIALKTFFLQLDLFASYSRNVDGARNEEYSFYKDKNNRLIEKNAEGKW